VSEHPTSLADIIGGQAGAAHSIYSPSGSAMWLRCLGSLIPNVLAGDDAGEEAAEGTVAHDVADGWAKSGVRPAHLIGTVVVENGYEIEITEEMLAYIEDYLRWCEDVGYEGLTHYSEERVDHSILMPIPNQKGTADHFACGPGIMVLTDLKYGKGVPVYCAEIPEDNRTIILHDDGTFTINGNSQVLLYAAGVFIRYDHLYHFEKIVIRICQPRLGYFGVWETTRSELLAFMQFVMDRAPGCLDPNAPRTPGPKQCQFCRVKATCAARLAHLQDLVDDVFHDLTATRDYTVEEMATVAEIISDPLTIFDPILPKPVDLSIESLEKILPMRKMVEGWFAAIEEYLIRQARDYEVELRVWKLVEGRTNRKFIDEKIAAKRLLEKGLTKDDIYTTSTASPAQAEEALHKRLKIPKKEAAAMLEDLTVRPPGPRSLVLRTDNRPELPNPGDVFQPILQPDEL
jgi:hypothetical protein